MSDLEKQLQQIFKQSLDSYEGELLFKPPWESVEAFSVCLGTKIEVGQNGEQICSEARYALEKFFRHWLIVGGTRKGKSYFVDLLARTLLWFGIPVCIVDPHGEVYERIIAFCQVAHEASFTDPNVPEHFKTIKERLIPFDPCDDDVMGFNPFQKDSDPDYIISSIMQLVKRLWHLENFDEGPRMARWIYNVLASTYQAGGTLDQTIELCLPEKNEVHKAVMAKIKNPILKKEWNWLFNSTMRTKDVADMIGSTFNRIRPLFSNERIALMFSQKTKTINFQKVLEEGKSLLVNLSQRATIEEDEQKLIGSFIINELATAAFNREKKKGTLSPYFLFIDEFETFATPDIPKILSGANKFRLHLVLAHQYLEQIAEENKKLFYGALSCCTNKIVFGGIGYAGSEILARELLLGELDPYKVKQEIERTFTLPLEEMRKIWSFSASQSSVLTEGGFEAQSINNFFSKTTSDHINRSYSNKSLINMYLNLIPSQVNIGPPETATTGTGVGTSSGKNWSEAAGQSAGATVTYQPSKRDIIHKEVSSREFFSLADQLLLKIHEVNSQPDRHCLVTGLADQVDRMYNEDLPDFTDYAKQQPFIKECRIISGAFNTKKDAREERKRNRVEFLDQFAAKFSQQYSANQGAGNDQTGTTQSNPYDDDNTGVMDNDEEIVVSEESEVEKQNDRNNRTTTESDPSIRRNANSQPVQYGSTGVSDSIFLDKKLEAISKRYQEIEQTIERDARWNKQTSDKKG
jgi:hypothetical protein